MIPETTQNLLSRAFQLHQGAHLVEAEQLYRQILARDPMNFDALHLLGLLAHQNGNHHDGIDLMSRAAAIDPRVPEVHANLALALRAAGMVQQAVDRCRAALQLKPDFPDAKSLLAVCLTQQGHVEPALTLWRDLLSRAPNDPQVHANMAVTLERASREDEAIAACDRAIALDPKFVAAHHTRATVLLKQGKLAATIDACERAIALQPDFQPAYATLFLAQQRGGRVEDIIDLCKRRRITRFKQSIDGYRDLAWALADKGDVDKAKSTCQDAIAMLRSRVASDPAAARQINYFVLTSAVALPPVYDSMDDLVAQRNHLEREIRLLHARGVRFSLEQEPAPTLFSLAYQGMNDRDIQSEYARLISAPQGQSQIHAMSKTGKMRVGFLSRYFYNHTIGQLNIGLIENLSRDDFHVTVFVTGAQNDELAQRFRDRADVHLSLPASLSAARALILEQKLDVLIYAEIGIDPFAYSLAFSRLAPVQCVSWGHPVTSGIEEIDYFISSELIEPANAEHHYTERLVRLKSLGLACERPILTAPRTRDDFSLPADANLYGCLQMLQKIHPEFDELIAAVLWRDPNGLLLLPRGRNEFWDERLMKRFERSIPDVLDRVRWFPRMEYQQYLALTTLCHVMLVPVRFGSGRTSFDALAMGVPCVTMPSPLMRGRITAGLYRQIGNDDCIVDSSEAYVDLAVRLGTDREHRRQISDRILTSNDALFDSRTGAKELESFLFGLRS